MYAMTNTRPNIAFAIGQLNQNTTDPGVQQWNAIYRVLKYLKGTLYYSVLYIGYHSVMEGFSDAVGLKMKRTILQQVDEYFCLGMCHFMDFQETNMYYVLYY